MTKLKKHLSWYAALMVAWVAFSYYIMPEFSVFGFVLIALFALEAAAESFQKLFQDTVDVDEELRRDNRSVSIVVAARYIAYAIVIGAALMGVPKAHGQPAHVIIAQKYVGTIEKHGNRGAVIDSWNVQAGAALGSPYCASFVSFCLTSSHAVAPKYRGAYSRSYIDKTSLSLPLKSDIDLTGWLLVFSRKGGGHIAIIREGHGGLVRTIEANTSPEGYAGSQFDGGGVFNRDRNLKVLSSPYNMFRATHVTRVLFA